MDKEDVMPNDLFNRPSLSDPGVISKCEIFNMIDELEPEEIEAIERYCINYHEAYRKADGAPIVTEITVG